MSEPSRFASEVGWDGAIPSIFCDSTEFHWTEKPETHMRVLTTVRMQLTTGVHLHGQVHVGKALAHPARTGTARKTVKYRALMSPPSVLDSLSRLSALVWSESTVQTSHLLYTRWLERSVIRPSESTRPDLTLSELADRRSHPPLGARSVPFG